MLRARRFFLKALGLLGFSATTSALIVDKVYFRQKELIVGDISINVPRAWKASNSCCWRDYEVREGGDVWSMSINYFELARESWRWIAEINKDGIKAILTQEDWVKLNWFPSVVKTSGSWDCHDADLEKVARLLLGKAKPELVMRRKRQEINSHLEKIVKSGSDFEVTIRG